MLSLVFHLIFLLVASKGFRLESTSDNDAIVLASFNHSIVSLNVLNLLFVHTCIGPLHKRKKKMNIGIVFSSSISMYTVVSVICVPKVRCNEEKKCYNERVYMKQFTNRLQEN